MHHYKTTLLKKQIHNSLSYVVQEEWVVCRVFKKSSSGKKPLPSTSSLPSPLDSACNTASVTEIGELDASSILNNMVNPSGSFNSMQTNESSNTNNNNRNLYMNMNWMLAREATSQPLLPWPASLIGPGLISSGPPILKASPFNGYQAADATNMSSLNSFMGQGEHSFHASSSKGTETVQQHQQQQHEHESIWRGY